MSSGIGIATLIPMRAACFYSDGGRWLRIRRKGFEARLEAASLRIVQSYYINKNYSNLSIEDTQILKTDSDSRNKYLGHFYAYRYYKENHDIEGMEVESETMKGLEKLVPKNFVKLLSM